MSARAIVALVIVLVLAAIGAGAAFQQRRISAAQADTVRIQRQLENVTGERDTARQERDAARNNVHIVTEYVDRVREVRVAGATITKEIPVYVTPEADAACPIPAGFVRIHDTAAANLPAQPAAGDPDAPAAGLTLSAVAETVADNYTTCHEVRQQVIGLQDYVRTLPVASPQ